MADDPIPFPDKQNDPVPDFGSDGLTNDEPATAAERLRSFEDEHLGEDAPRHQGAVEKGSGSLFQRLSPNDQKCHAALEKACETEARVNDARAALAAAESEHAAAVKAADDASKLGG